MSVLRWLGVGNSKVGDASSHFDYADKYVGLKNLGNTCYCNSVIQALYHCRSFREAVEKYPHVATREISVAQSISQSHYCPSIDSSCPVTNTAQLNQSPKDGVSPTSRVLHPSTSPLSPKLDEPNLSSPSSVESVPKLKKTDLDDSLLSEMHHLFIKISSIRKKSGAVVPANFISKVRKDNELFRNTMHQDAHEFLNWLLNAIAEILLEKKRKQEESRKISNNTGQTEKTATVADGYQTWVHELFEGILTNEIKCLNCETVSERKESFLDLSIDISENSSVTSCLRQFSSSEMLCMKNKFFCDSCGALQEAEKRMKIKRLPYILALHLKRFKYHEDMNKYVKLGFKVVFPTELRLFNTCDDSEDRDRLYKLHAVVVHIGGGPQHGHYITAINIKGDRWLLFDDENVTHITENDISRYFGESIQSGSGYVLFYQADGLVAAFDQEDTLPPGHLSSRGSESGSMKGNYSPDNRGGHSGHSSLKEHVNTFGFSSSGNGKESSSHRESVKSSGGSSLKSPSSILDKIRRGPI